MSQDRTKQSVRDLLLSMGVVALFVAFLFVAVWRPAPDPIRTVDVAEPLRTARAQASYEVLAPTGLSADWKPTSARFEAEGSDATSWFLGYVTPGEQYIAVTQSDSDPEAFIVEQTLQGTPEGQSSIDGEQWQQYLSGDQRSLVLTGPEATTVVTGTVSYPELEQFAQRLRGE